MLPLRPALPNEKLVNSWTRGFGDSVQAADVTADVTAEWCFEVCWWQAGQVVIGRRCCHTEVEARRHVMVKNDYSWLE
jgi:hypothetical protein